MTKIFISYSHKDEAKKNTLNKHLAVLTHAGIALEPWDDRRIQGGEDWRQEIRAAIEGCSIALLLISADFLTSNFILDEEVPRLLERRAQAGVRVIPIIVAPCQWQLVSWLVPLQARPLDGKPLSKLGKAKLDDVLSNLAGEIHRLHTQGFTLKPVPVASAPVPAPEPAITRSPAAVELPPAPSARPHSLVAPLYGRQELQARMAEGLATHDVLALYGFRGNGKTVLIEQLQRSAPAHLPTEWVRVNAAREHSAADLFARLADALCERADCPVPPTGSVEEIATQLRQRYPEAKPVVVWVDKAHTWFTQGERWADEELGKLFRALRKALGQRWRWVLELREKPGAALHGAEVLTLEVPGIDRAGLAAWLQASAPAGQEAGWRYSGDELKRLYQWLGNRRDEDRSQAANPLATRLLIEVATARNSMPVEVLRRLLSTVEQRVDAALLADLYDTVLNPQERDLLNAVALYRDAMPTDHIERLEAALALPASWDGLERRCMLATDANGERWFLHGFVAGWVRHRLGYPSSDDLWTDSGLPDDLSPEQRRLLQRWHAAVAECWLKQVEGARRVTRPNLLRAREAFHHLLCADRADRLVAIAVELLGGPDEARVVQRLWDYDNALFQRGASRSERVVVLDLITRLDGQDPRSWRYLGESLSHVSASPDRIQRCFEQALALSPEHPANLANLGKLLLSRGADGAQTFLDRLAQHRQQYPEAVNDHVLAIAAQCLMKTGQLAQASQLRRERIEAGTSNPAFYVDEANHQLSLNQAEKALPLLDLAQQRGAANDYSLSIRATALAQSGQAQAASQLRCEQIRAGSRHPAFYSAEADYQLSMGEKDEAQRCLDQVNRLGIGDDVTRALQVKLNQHR